MKRNWTSNAISRRAALGALGGASMSLPFIGSEVARAQGVIPPRFIVMFSPNGTVLDEWRPTGGENDLQFKRILEPLTPYKDALLVLEGLDMKSAGGKGPHHEQGIGQLLTAVPCLFENKEKPLFPTSAGGISFDQVLAKHIGKDTLLPSIQLGVQTKTGKINGNMVYADRGRWLPAENNAQRAFEALFGKLDSHTANPTTAAGPSIRQSSVIDYATRRFGKMGQRVGRESRERLEIHHDAIRDIEAQLSRASTPTGSSCMIPTSTGSIDWGANNNFPQICKMQMDNIVAAFACDVTRVATLTLSWAVGQTEFRWLGINDPHHEISHNESKQREENIRINQWYAEQFAYLLGKLQSIPEGNGNMLDNTVVLWAQDLATAGKHSNLNMPMVMAGNVDGYFRTGRYLAFDNPAHSNLYLSIAHAMGLELDKFGSHSTGRLDRLR